MDVGIISTIISTIQAQCDPSDLNFSAIMPLEQFYHLHTKRILKLILDKCHTYKSIGNYFSPVVLTPNGPNEFLSVLGLIYSKNILSTNNTDNGHESSLGLCKHGSLIDASALDSLKDIRKNIKLTDKLIKNISTLTKTTFIVVDIDRNRVTSMFKGERVPINVLLRQDINKVNIMCIHLDGQMYMLTLTNNMSHQSVLSLTNTNHDHVQLIDIINSIQQDLSKENHSTTSLSVYENIQHTSDMDSAVDDESNNMIEIECTDAQYIDDLDNVSGHGRKAIHTRRPISVKLIPQPPKTKSSIRQINEDALSKMKLQEIQIIAKKNKIKLSNQGKRYPKDSLIKKILQQNDQSDSDSD